MIITVASNHGAGKSTTVDLLLEALPNMHKVDISRRFRELAAERGMNADDFTEFLTQNADESEQVDREIDEYQKQQIEKGNVIVDSNLGAMLAPKATLKVFLKCDIKKRAKRVFEGGLRYGDKIVETPKQMEKQLETRDKNDQERYKKLYGFDMFNHKHYDLILNSGENTKKEVVQNIMDELKRRNPNAF